MERNKVIMIVEDDESISELMGELLSDELQVDTVFAAGFGDACHRLEELEHAPDLFVMDVNLLDGDGRELLTDLFLGRFGSAAGGKPVIVCSGQVSSADIKAWGALSNFAGFLSKPFRPDELVSLAQSALSPA